jgi:hypothetical protein
LVRRSTLPCSQSSFSSKPPDFAPGAASSSVSPGRRGSQRKGRESQRKGRAPRRRESLSERHRGRPLQAAPCVDRTSLELRARRSRHDHRSPTRPEATTPAATWASIPAAGFICPTGPGRRVALKLPAVTGLPSMRTMLRALLSTLLVGSESSPRGRRVLWGQPAFSARYGVEKSIRSYVSHRWFGFSESVPTMRPGWLSAMT